jgi:hypothetical protein
MAPGPAVLIKKAQKDPARLADDPLLYMSVKRMKLKRARNVS